MNAAAPRALLGQAEALPLVRRPSRVRASGSFFTTLATFSVTALLACPTAPLLAATAAAATAAPLTAPAGLPACAVAARALRAPVQAQGEGRGWPTGEGTAD
ncbi:hypothetical protein TSOC_010887 [Tetrabaena socialis]|uniref:Uncharacterized protein n=1 Tax=Tetrabaena socialis TaxID=47790 RepID=A0A2J7ZS49_9CHLO|nr:hypothetical protein TSOC_010887 [Tetrabaena socialis]|eukprot:PNH03094.1 hypothetical protein TSOC_010887 [Tetrabaena socialis]